MKRSTTATTTAEAPADCGLCPRLTQFRADNRVAYPHFFNGAVPSFGPAENSVRLLIVGLAPGLQGANRTGRPFTGDYAGDLLYATLLKFGLATGTYGARPDDGLMLRETMITNAVRCVPPENKPTGPEITTCRPFLATRINSLLSLRVVICLGKISHDSTLKALEQKPARLPFGHATVYDVSQADRALTIVSSYHCSRYNTNTGRLTVPMFEDVFAKATALLAQA